MFEIFMAVCALTVLECNDITVTYYDLADDNWHAAAAIDSKGQRYILVNDTLEDKSERFMRRVMVHEIAHLLAFKLDPMVTDHNEIYTTICRDLAALAEVTNRNTCKPYSEPPPYPWTINRRE